MTYAIVNAWHQRLLRCLRKQLDPCTDNQKGASPSFQRKDNSCNSMLFSIEVSTRPKWTLHNQFADCLLHGGTMSKPFTRRFNADNNAGVTLRRVYYRWEYMIVDANGAMRIYHKRTVIGSSVVFAQWLKDRGYTPGVDTLFECIGVE